ncbi:MAG: deoxyguanosinetriphosphate triphosphohydrolase [Proteobacteria bacterium]|nr:deoxyguanosinetriphosphate triphosphohydrolase [Pseudomonadota bacterium]MBU1741805.1 deoxyguanosinetriphosphate triphosphohydrolase [Pseudomonadota bacterium]
MNLREQLEEAELERLRPEAAKARFTRGRSRPEPECQLRTAFMRDRDRIVHSKPFRRLKHKTQVFLAPTGDHYRTRLTHTLEVAQIARTVSRVLGLNEDLTEAIALGHDLGHTPFGHAGEEALRQIVPGGFDHNQQSYRIVEYLARDGRGLNLTFEVGDGILHHTKGRGPILETVTTPTPATLEGQVVRLADIIAYICHDTDDALRGGVISSQDIPAPCRDVLGPTSARRIDAMVRDVVRHSLETNPLQVTLSPRMMEVMTSLRNFLYENVYEVDTVHRDFDRATKLIHDLYELFVTEPDKLAAELGRPVGEDVHQEACDFIAGMTDRYALMLFGKLFLPSPWAVL